MLYINEFGHVAHWSTWFKTLLKPSQETTHFLLTHFSWLWWIVNNVGFIQDTVMRAVYFCKYYYYNKIFDTYIPLTRK